MIIIDGITYDIPIASMKAAEICQINMQREQLMGFTS